ncbi:MAG: guanylate kinase [Oscillospiraceae bacterium]|nr:guanylate kinase [Oscillospiraceae bacterium]
MTTNKAANNIFVLSGPSGCGKDTVVKCLKLMRDDIFLSVSCTTRAPREGEKEGVDYYYLTQEQFDELVETGQMLEYNFYAGNYYGTSCAELERGRDLGKVVILVIDVNGAHNVRRLYPDSTLIFLLPPSMEVLRERIARRGVTNDVEERMEIARAEIEDSINFDVRIVNDDLEKCVREVSDLIDQKMNQDKTTGGKETC